MHLLLERERERETTQIHQTKYQFCSSTPAIFLQIHFVSLKMKPNLFQIVFIFLSLCNFTSAITTQSDSTALLAFKSKADLGNKLSFSPNTSLNFCKWVGVECLENRVVRVVLEGLGLSGEFEPNTLTRLYELRVLSLKNNSLTGPVPDVSGLVNLKTLFLDHNSFTGSIPNSISTLHRLRTLDLSFNNFTGSISQSLNNLDRLFSLRLESNWLTGSIPPLNQTYLNDFNVSNNNLTGVIPLTPSLLRFSSSSFSLNPGLCGKIIGRECRPRVPFFDPSPAEGPQSPSPPPAVAIGQNEQLQGVELTQPSQKKHTKTAVIIGFSSGVLVLIGSIIFFTMAVKKHRKKTQKLSPSPAAVMAADSGAAASAAVVCRIGAENELEERVKRMIKLQVGKSGSLVFCAGESQVYTVDQLMSASAEILGRGTVGTTYKAVLDNRLIVCVKRFDAVKLAGTSEEVFERHMESVGGLRHPNLVPLRAYFQAKEERLVVYDYYPNGSLFSLIHDSKSARAKPLHWTSCLKIAEDIAQGLSYIHQAWRLIHGNLKSSNVLLGPDFEACLTDYSLSVLATNHSSDHNPTALAYKAPETQKSNCELTSKSDVYAYGVLLVELLTGKSPIQNLYQSPDDMIKWFRSARDNDGGEDEQLGMLLEVALACSVASPEQRPTMWQVLKMIQEIKEVVAMDEDNKLEPITRTS